jgi:hypothetical protein
MRSIVAVACGVAVFLFASFIDGPAAAQQPVDHTQHVQPAPAATTAIDLPPQREGSGTSWLPDETPMYAVHGDYGEWQLMGHGSVFLQFLKEGGDRGADQFGSVNWAMGMAQRRLGQGRLGLRAMMSLEPWTINGCGYPDLLASGEICDGRPIVDRQHPHDLFMELGATYDRPLSSTLALQLYGGLAGEPALGPVAFPHRISAMPNPLAPLSHHWLDATHIAFGVMTGGVYSRQWKIEGSIFNGREPDDARHDFDFGALDSFAGRAWFLPTDEIALQFSAGHLTEAEADEAGGPRTDVNRVTASATYHRRFRDGGSLWASTAGFGRNTEEGESTSFVLAETNVTFDEQDTYFGRLEIGRKSAHDLDIHDSIERFTVAKVQAGYVRYLEAWNSLKPGVGATLSMSLVPTALADLYGNRATFGFGVFLTLRPAAMGSGADAHAGHPVP